MKITIYTVNDCQFSKQEKDYLTSHQLQFEEKNLETNKEFLTEMLAISDNFAGTPVTKVEKDDGTSLVLKGFTPSEFDEALGLKSTEQPIVQKDSQSAQPGVVEPSAPDSVAPPTSTPDLSGVSTVPTAPPSVSTPVVEPPTQLTQDPTQPLPPTAEPAQPTTPPAVEPPKPPQDQDPKLASILGNLQSMSTTPTTDQPTTDKPATVSSGMPSVPDPNFG